MAILLPRSFIFYIFYYILYIYILYFNSRLSELTAGSACRDRTWGVLSRPYLPVKTAAEPWISFMEEGLLEGCRAPNLPGELDLSVTQRRPHG